MVDSSDPENLAVSSDIFSTFCNGYLSPSKRVVTWDSVFHLFGTGRVILHPDLRGAPLLILANKQDRPVSANKHT